MCVVSHIHWPHVSPCSTWMVSSKVHICGDEEPVDPVDPVDPLDPVDPVEALVSFRKAPVGESDGSAKTDRCSACLIPAAPHLSEQERNRVIPMANLNMAVFYFGRTQPDLHFYFDLCFFSFPHLRVEADSNAGEWKLRRRFPNSNKIKRWH